MRIIQEALTNIRKHAAASRARVQIRCQDGILRLCIEDDGRGWDLAATPSQPSHIGLDSMRERAEMLGGKLHIDTAPGRGTRITAEVPLEDAQ
jgi:two-component system nitrate/nitrite sensor histidine kinase NarX